MFICNFYINFIDYCLFYVESSKKEKWTRPKGKMDSSKGKKKWTHPTSRTGKIPIWPSYLVKEKFILFYFILFHSILYYFILFYSIPYIFTLFFLDRFYNEHLL